MNAERLLDVYEQISEAPDAIARLRRFVLDLAVRGKLVEQDAADEPAARLVQRIEERKAEILSETAMRKPRKVADMDPAEIWSDLPANWTWTQISNLGFVSPRNDADDDVEASFVPMPMIFAEYGVANDHEVRPWAEIKKGYTHFAEGDVGLAKITPCFENGKSTVFRNLTGGFGSGTTELHILKPVLVDPDYVLLFLKSPQFIETGIPKMTGTAGQKRVSSEYFTSSPFPLPPLTEQHRIVAKVDELMALCDRLEEARKTREELRDKLTAASLARLTAPDTTTEDFPTHAAFALKALPALTTRPDQIKILRQTILNLAVRGKLVEQDPMDEPAETLEAAIFEAVCEISSKPGLLPQSNLPSSPMGWVISRIDRLTAVGTGVTPSKGEAKYFSGGTIPWVNSAATNEPEIRTTPHFVTDAAISECRLKLYPVGSLVVALYGQGKTRGQVSELRIPATVNQACAVLQFPKGYESIRPFILLTLKQQYEEMRAMAEGGAQPNLNLSKIKSRVIALPPLAEQLRIVAKVDALMALCDRLEAALTTTDTTRTRLIEALLHEALEPAATALEAAE